jgi:hypothetical protein
MHTVNFYLSIGERSGVIIVAAANRDVRIDHVLLQFLSGSG